MRILPDGWLTGLRRLPSPNCDQRPDPADISLLVIHAISLPPEQFHGPAVAQLFTNQLDPQAHPFFQQISDLRVSAHLFIRRHGGLLQFVSLDQRAWHAGVSSFAGRERCNDFSIGIELEGNDACGFTQAQYRQLLRLSRLLFQRYPLMTPQQVVGHCDIAPGRKTDPGPHFDWRGYRRALAQLAPEPQVAA